ncbi:hypothetical protein ROZALSC1DRAFT_31678, partial [Rozella allomycis CSF55]
MLLCKTLASDPKTPPAVLMQILDTVTTEHRPVVKQSIFNAMIKNVNSFEQLNSLLELGSSGLHSKESLTLFLEGFYKHDRFDDLGMLIQRYNLMRISPSLQHVHFIIRHVDIENVPEVIDSFNSLYNIEPTEDTLAIFTEIVYERGLEARFSKRLTKMKNKYNLKLNINILNAKLKGLCKRGKPLLAWDAFQRALEEEKLEPNVHSLNILASGFVDIGENLLAKRVFTFSDDKYKIKLNKESLSIFSKIECNLNNSDVIKTIENLANIHKIAADVSSLKTIVKFHLDNDRLNEAEKALDFFKSNYLCYPSELILEYFIEFHCAKGNFEEALKQPQYFKANHKTIATLNSYLTLIKNISKCNEKSFVLKSIKNLVNKKLIPVSHEILQKVLQGSNDLNFAETVAKELSLNFTKDIAWDHINRNPELAYQLFNHFNKFKWNLEEFNTVLKFIVQKSKVEDAAQLVKGSMVKPNEVSLFWIVFGCYKQNKHPLMFEMVQWFSSIHKIEPNEDTEKILS